MWYALSIEGEKAFIDHYMQMMGVPDDTRYEFLKGLKAHPSCRLKKNRRRSHPLRTIQMVPSSERTRKSGV